MTAHRKNAQVRDAGKQARTAHADGESARCGGGRVVEWPQVTLQSVARINPRDEDVRDLGGDTLVSFVPMQAVSEETASITQPLTRSLADVRRGYTPFKEGDLLLAKITPCMENGKCAIARPLVNGIGFGSTEFHVIRTGPELLTEFLYLYVRQISFRAAAKQHMRGGVGQQRVPEDFLRKERIPLPPLSEQRRIVEILDHADRLRRLRAEADAKAERILPALFIKMFGDPRANPYGWNTGQLGDVIVETQYGTSKRASSDGGGVLVLRMNNISASGRINLTDTKHVVLDEEELNRLALRTGDILFNRTNSAELVGKTGLWSRCDQPAVAASYLIRCRVDRAKVVPGYIWALMNTPFMKLALAAKARRAIGMANINATELRSLPSLFPPLQVQEAFVVRLRRLDELAASRRGSRDSVERLFQLLLHRALSGDLTTSWREAHMTELLQEMQHQAKAVTTLTRAD